MCVRLDPGRARMRGAHERVSECAPALAQRQMTRC